MIKKQISHASTASVVEDSNESIIEKKTKIKNTNLFENEIEARDNAYKNIRDGNHNSAVNARALCNELWTTFEPHADSHFRNEIAINFNDRFWEMDLTCAFIEAGYDVNCPKPGPDICITENGTSIWIEAICPGNGNGADQVPKPEVGVVQAVPDEKIILRLTSAISEKHKKYLGYVRDGTVRSDEPFIIAINACKIECARSDYDPPRIIRSVFPIGPEYLMIDRESGGVLENGFHFKSSVKKSNETEIPIDIFLNSEFSDISAVLFSVSDCCNRPNNTGDDFIMVHNPLSKNPINEGFLKLGKEYIAEEYSETEYQLRWNNYSSV